MTAAALASNRSDAMGSTIRSSPATASRPPSVELMIAGTPTTLEGWIAFLIHATANYLGNPSVLLKHADGNRFLIGALSQPPVGDRSNFLSIDDGSPTIVGLWGRAVLNATRRYYEVAPRWLDGEATLRPASCAGSRRLVRPESERSRMRLSQTAHDSVWIPADRALPSQNHWSTAIS
jgi:hypothetical protein